MNTYGLFAEFKAVFLNVQWRRDNNYFKFWTILTFTFWNLLFPPPPLHEVILRSRFLFPGLKLQFLWLIVPSRVLSHLGWKQCIICHCSFVYSCTSFSPVAINIIVSRVLCQRRARILWGEWQVFIRKGIFFNGGVGGGRRLYITKGEQVNCYKEMGLQWATLISRQSFRHLHSQQCFVEIGLFKHYCLFTSRPLLIRSCHCESF